MKVEEYKGKLEAEREKLVTRFRGHLGAFLGVNTFLAGIWYVTGAGFPWFLIPLTAWGIGLATHFDEVLRKRREVAELADLHPGNEEAIARHRKMAKARAGWRGHLVSTAATGILLFTINMITSPSFPWFLIPVGGMAIGLFTHFPAYRAKMARLRRGDDSPEPGKPRDAEETSGTTSSHARILRDQILDEISGRDELPSEQVAALLDDYLTRLVSLEQKKHQLRQLQEGLHGETARAELERIEKRMESLSEPRIQQEYRTSAAQLRRQMALEHELKEEAELIDLRLVSALSSLRQLRVELARAAPPVPPRELPSYGELRTRSEELARYLADLRQAYDDLTP